jgi:hypothetical protein
MKNVITNPYRPEERGVHTERVERNGARFARAGGFRLRRPTCRHHKILVALIAIGVGAVTLAPLLRAASPFSPGPFPLLQTHKAFAVDCVPIAGQATRAQLSLRSIARSLLGTKLGDESSATDKLVKAGARFVRDEADPNGAFVEASLENNAFTDEDIDCLLSFKHLRKVNVS